MDEMDARLGDLTVQQFTALLIKVLEDVIDEKLENKPQKGDTEEIRKKKIEAILGL